MNRRHLLIGSVASGLSAALTGPAARAQLFKPEAPDVARAMLRGGDMFLTNAKIATLDAPGTIAEAALVRRGRIVAVGRHRDLRKDAAGVPHFDAGRRTVIPGFVEVHNHVEESCVMGDNEPSVAGLVSIEEIVSRIRTIAAGRAKGEWIQVQAGEAFDFETRIAERRWLTRQDLDRATEDHPVIVLFGIHFAAMNSAAWRLTPFWDGGSADTVRWKNGNLPRRGSYVPLGTDGHPLGMGTEIWDFRPPYTVEQYKQGIARHFRNLWTSKGITTTASLQNDPRRQLPVLQQLQQEGLVPARLRAYPMVPQAVALEEVVANGWQTGFGDDMFRFGGVKIFVDGIGWDFSGREVVDVKWDPDELASMLTVCQEAGLQSILHIATPAGFALALEALEVAQRKAPGRLRHHLDHFTPGDDATIERCRRLGVVFGVTPPRTSPGSPPEWFFHHRYRTLAEKGLYTTTLDASFPDGNYHPMMGIANIINGGPDSVVPAGETLTIDQALRSNTIWAANSIFEGNEKGSIEVGKLGDFAVLSMDPFGKTPAEVHAITTEATILGGSLVFGQ